MDGGRVSTLVVFQAPGAASWLGTAVRQTAHVSGTVRIGITREVSRLLLFFEAGCPFASAPSTRTMRRHESKELRYFLQT